MIINLGTIRPGSTIVVPFHTFDSNDPSASTTITGLATSDIEIYKDGSTTQRASDAGYALLDTDGIDFDTITGIHGVSIDLADNTTAGFYAAGSQYMVVISSITIDAATVNFIPVIFNIGYPDAVLNTSIASLSSQTSFTLTSGPAEDDALHSCVVCIHDVASAIQLGFAVVSDYTGSTKTVTLTAGVTFTAAATDNISFFPPVNARWFAALTTSALPLTPTTAGRTLDVSAGGEAGIDWANVGSPTTAVNLSATNIDVDQAVASVSGAVGSVTGNVGGNVTGSVGSLVGHTVQTGDSFARIGVAGAGLTAVPWNAAWDAEVQSEVADALVVYDPPTNTELTSGLAALNDISAAEVNAEVVDALNTDTYAEPGQGDPAATASLATKIGYLYKNWRNKKDQTSTLWRLYGDDGVTVDQDSTVSDDGTTAVKGEVNTGA
jgi:hypothetical protein